jgi:hypothetical protein
VTNAQFAGGDAAQSLITTTTGLLDLVRVSIRHQVEVCVCGAMQVSG